MSLLTTTNEAIQKKLSSLEEKFKIHEIDKTRLENLVCTLKLKTYELEKKLEKSSKFQLEDNDNSENFQSFNNDNNKENFKNSNFLKKRRSTFSSVCKNNNNNNTNFENLISGRKKNKVKFNSINESDCLNLPTCDDIFETKYQNLEKKISKIFQKIEKIEKSGKKEIFEKKIEKKFEEKVDVSEVQIALNEMQKKLKDYVDGNNENIKINFLNLKENLTSKMKKMIFSLKNELKENFTFPKKTSISQMNTSRGPITNLNKRRSSLGMEGANLKEINLFFNEVLTEISTLKEENQFLKTLVNTKTARKGKIINYFFLIF